MSGIALPTRARARARRAIRLDPRWQKVVRDLWGNKARTALVVLSIAVGVFAFSSTFISGEAMLSNMNSQWRSTTPSAIALWLPPFDEDLARAVRGMRGVQDAQARAAMAVKVIRQDGKPYTMTIEAARDFEHMSVARILPDEGNFPPGRRELLLERATVAFLGVEVGDTLTIELADGQQRTLTLTGIVHDLNAIPPHLYPILSGYASLETLRWLGHSGAYSTLDIATDPALTDLQAINDVAADIRQRLRQDGIPVYSTYVQDPTKHWGADITRGITAVLAGIGFLSLALSGLLVTNTLSSVLAQQQRQIGMMRAIGATRLQVTGIYLMMTLAFGALALLISVPVGLALAYQMTWAVAGYLNFDVLDFHIPGWVIGLQIVTSLAVPLIAAYLPILRGSRMTVREALQNYGISGIAPISLTDRLLARVRGLSRPVLLSLRNTFRRKGRLWLTLGTLTFAGATFMAVVNTRGSMIGELEVVLNLFHYDVGIYLDDAYPVRQIEHRAGEVPGVVHAEGWAFARVQRVRPDQEEGPTFSLLAPPPGSPLLRPTLLAGRWLRAGDRNAIVLASTILQIEPDIEVGDTITLNVNGLRRDWEVIGIFSSFGQNHLAYTSFDCLTRALGASGQAWAVFIRSEKHDAASERAVADALEERFKDQGIVISQIETMAEVMQSSIGQMDFLVYFLLFLALLIALVGGLGLAGTMSLNVLERTREIGVMRAVGARNSAIRGIVVIEGVLIGLLSWALSIPLSIPLTYGLTAGVGLAVFQRPVMFTFAPSGVVLWLVLVTAIAAIASLLPAHRASRVTVHEALAYE